MAFDKIRIIYPQVIYLITDVLLLEILGLESVHGRFLTLFFFLPGFSFTNIHESQDCRGRGRAFHYHFHPLHRHLDISRAITAGSSPLHIASSRTRTGNLWFPHKTADLVTFTE